MERLRYTFRGGRPSRAGRTAQIVGVVASGNLEVLIEPSTPEDVCAVEVSTAADGFGAIWEAVVGDFFARWGVGGVRVSINDAGATPATVALRLDQAVEAYEGDPA